jgi:hypothetical protein
MRGVLGDEALSGFYFIVNMGRNFSRESYANLDWWSVQPFVQTNPDIIVDYEGGEIWFPLDLDARS